MPKVHKPQGGDAIVVESGGVIQIKTGGKIVPNSGALPANIANLVAITGGEAPTEAEHNAVRTALNSVLAVMRGAGLIAAS